jgi:hypothetical protein
MPAGSTIASPSTSAPAACSWTSTRSRRGVDFSERLDEAVGACSLLIALIGEGWLAARDAAGHRRLDDPEDFVHQELAAALARGGLRVIPVLVEGATMPRAEDLPNDLKPLARRNARELSHARWEYDAGRLVEAAQRSAAAPAPLPPRPGGAATPAAAGRRRLPAARRIARGCITGFTGDPFVASVDADGKIGGIWVTDSGAGEVVRIDPVTGKRSKPIDVTAEPNDIAVREGFVWTADSDFHGRQDAAFYVSRVDPESRAVKEIDVGGRPAGIGTGDGYARVTSDRAGWVQTIDPRSGAIVGNPIAVGLDPQDVVLDHGSVWVAVSGSGEVARVDPRTRKVDVRIAVGF